MSDPGWDIPGVPREPSPGAEGPASSPASPAAASPAGGLPPRRGRSARRSRAASVSASSGLSAGAFARLAHSDPPAPASPADSQDGTGINGAASTATAGADCGGSEGLRAGWPATGTRSGTGTGTGTDGGPGTAGTADAATTTATITTAGLVDSAGTGRAASANTASTATADSASRIADSLGAASPAAIAAGTGAAAEGVLPDSPAQALAFVAAGLDYLAHANPADWDAGVQADCLRALAVAESQQAAAHARVLGAFSVPGGGLAGDGHRSPRVWLTWQCAATQRAAATKVSWMHRLNTHPLVAATLAAGSVSVSWAQEIIDWTKALPEEVRDQAEAELLDAAANGASLSDLAGIAQELRRKHAQPDKDDDGFEDRSLRLVKTFGGAGRLDGDLDPRCAAATETVLGALAQPRGPEDTRTIGQRQHDALEEAMTRLLAADGLLPQRAGQPVRLELDITLEQLANLGAGSAAGPGSTCDAVIQPVITGLLDSELLAELTDQVDSPGGQPVSSDGDGPAAGDRELPPTPTGTGDPQLRPDEQAAAGDHGLLASYADPQWRERLQEAAARAAGQAPFGDVLALAVALLSGPSGRAAWLRRRVIGIPVSTISLPLDIAATFDTIPVHLRRAVRKRDKHCRFPGCDMPAAGCEVHHITHRKDGGRHALTNLALLCRLCRRRHNRHYAEQRIMPRSVLKSSRCWACAVGSAA